MPLQFHTTRRSVLAGMTAVAGSLTLGRTALGMLDAPSGRPDEFLSGKYGGKLTPFPMTQVRLLDGLLKTQAEINQTYLASLSTDRLLHSFRVTAGITSTATPYGGWEKPDCELRGHFNGGHYLSAVALAYASSGNDTLRKNGDTMVAELARCQKANNNGFLSAYPETLFETLAKGGKVWAPFYTLHKIMAGLVDMYVHTGNEQALQTAEDMAGWVQAYFQGIGDDQRMFMLRTEYGGMNEVMANLYGLTGRQRFLDIAHLFEQATFLDPLAAHRDDLRGLHANTHVPKVIGAARMYELTGDSRYRDIAQYFLEEVLTERCYCIGNTSVGESWRSDPGNLKGSLEYHDAECCVAYNLMKLERHAFSWTGDAKWMDAYERQLWNCRMGTQNDQGLKQYFFPLAAGYWRYYHSADDSFWCCTGTGVEEFAKFNDTIYFHDSNSVWVNQFIASELDWKEQNFGLRQDTNFPVEQGTTLRIKTPTPQKRTIHIRIPGWTNGGSVRINGRELEAFAQPGSYLSLTREWRDGDKIELSLPMSLRSEPLLGDPTLRAASYGPLVLAADLGPGPKGDGPLKISHGRGTAPSDTELGPPAAAPVAPAGEVTTWLEAASPRDLAFKANGNVPVKPMYRIADEKYAVYWSTEKKA
ncbi:MAG TPA: glycoside hydrolase family 127 protein [Acidobacteriaceae bacterium]